MPTDKTALRERRQTKRQGRRQRYAAFWNERRIGDSGDPAGKAVTEWDEIRSRIAKLRGSEARDRAWTRLLNLLQRFDPEM